jgi:hypothetical protein
MNVETMFRTVEDYEDTSYAEVFADLPPDHMVAVAFDRDSELYCALALAAGQTQQQAETEARFQLARYVAGHR